MKNTTYLLQIAILSFLFSIPTFAGTYRIKTVGYTHLNDGEIEYRTDLEYHLRITSVNQYSLQLTFLTMKIQESQIKKKNMREQFEKVKNTKIEIKRGRDYQFQEAIFLYNDKEYTTNDFLQFKQHNVPKHIKSIVKLIRRSIVFRYSQKQSSVGDIFEIKHRKNSSTGEDLSLRKVVPYKFHLVKDLEGQRMYVGNIQKQISTGDKVAGYHILSQQLKCFNESLHLYECQKLNSYYSQNPDGTLTNRSLMKPLEND